MAVSPLREQAISNIFSSFFFFFFFFFFPLPSPSPECVVCRNRSNNKNETEAGKKEKKRKEKKRKERNPPVAKETALRRPFRSVAASFQTFQTSSSTFFRLRAIASIPTLNPSLPTPLKKKKLLIDRLSHLLIDLMNYY